MICNNVLRSFVGVWVSFLTGSSAGHDSAPGRCRGPGPPRERLGDGGRSGTRFPEPGGARPNPPLSPGKGSLLSSSSGCPGPGMAASGPLRHLLPPSVPHPGLLAFRSPDARPAGAVAVFPRPEPSAAGAPSQSAPQDSAPGQGTRRPVPPWALDGPGNRPRPRGGDPAGATGHAGLRGALRKAAVGPSVPARVPVARAAPFSAV